MDSAVKRQQVDIILHLFLQQYLVWFEAEFLLTYIHVFRCKDMAIRNVNIKRNTEYYVMPALRIRVMPWDKKQV